MSNYYYLDVSLKFDAEPENNVTAVLFKRNIIQAVDELFGTSVSSVPIDLLKYDPKSFRAILRVPKTNYVKIRSSLTLCGSYGGQNCAYIVHKSAPFLLALQNNSREYIHQ